jgi:hypothetical protein
MNNRLKAALLIVSLVAVTPQMQAAWYHPSTWFAGIQSAANTINQKVKNYLFPAPASHAAVVPAASNPGIFSRVAQWWSGKNTPAATLQDLATRIKAQVPRASLDLLKKRDAEKQDEAKQWIEEINQRDQLLKLSKETIGQRDRHIESLNGQLANEQTKRLNETNKLITEKNILITDRDVAERAHAELSLLTETLEKDRNDFANRLEEAKTKANDLELDLKITEYEKETLENKIKSQQALLSNPAIIQALRPPSKPKTTNGVAETAESFTNISSLGDSWTEVKLDQAQSALFDAAIQNGFDKIAQHIQVDSEYARNQISLGKQYTLNLLIGTNLHEIPTATQEEYMKSIVAIQWYLYSKALEKEQGFTEGTFKIEDRGLKIYNFLMDYVKMHNKDITGTPKDPLAYISYNPFGYSRDTSHYTDEKKIHSAYGIDVRLGPSLELALLPADKRHILFGKLDKLNEDSGWIYIKPENHGIYWYDGLPYHVNEFLVAQSRKNSWITSTLAWFGINLGSDDAETSRKERNIENFIKDIVQVLGKKHPLINVARKDGMKIIHTADEFAKNEKLKEIAEQYKQQYDHTEHRNGREVILVHDTLLRDASSKNKEKKQ